MELSKTKIKVFGVEQFKHFLSIEKNDHVSLTAIGLVDVNGKDVKMYIKFFKPIHTKSLVNEVVGYLIANGISLPIADTAGIVRLPSSYLQSLNALGAGINTNDKFITGFASSDLKGNTLGSVMLNGANNDKILKELSRNNFWHAIVAYDDWVANIDRHLNNLMRSSDGSYKIFDHSHNFTCSNWQYSDLKPEREYENRFLDALGGTRISNKDCSSILLQISKHYASLGDSLPEIKYWINMLLSKQESSSLITFINDRSIKRKAVFSNNVGMLNV